MSLELLYGVELGLSNELLTSIARDAEECAQIPLQPHKAIVGRNAFAHETGLGVAGLLRDPFTAESYDPKLVGQARSIVIGKKSGRKSLEFKLGSLGIVVEQRALDGLLRRVKAVSIARKRALTDAEIVQAAESEAREAR